MNAQVKFTGFGQRTWGAYIQRRLKSQRLVPTNTTVAE